MIDIAPSQNDRLFERLRQQSSPKKSGKKFVNTQVPEEAYWRLRRISLERHISIQELLCVGLNKVLEDANEPTFPIDRPRRGRPPEPR